MNKFTKRLLSIMLSVLMVLSVMPTAFAEDAVVEDNTVIEEVEGETSEEVSEEVPEITSDSLLFGKSYETNVGEWHTANTAADNGFLTDGLYAGTWWDKEDVEYFAAKNCDVEIVFDFEETVDFEEVKFAFLEDTGSGIHNPHYLAVYAINGEEETLIYDAKVPATRFSLVSDEAITADKLRIETVSDGLYTFIDEIEVYAEAKNDGYAMGETTPLVNVVEGMTYTIEGVTKWYNGNTDDSAATKLTDGNLSWGSSYNSTTNFGAFSNESPVITFNFDKAVDVAEIDLYTIFGRDGIGAPTVVIEYADGDNWTKIAEVSALAVKNFLVAKEEIVADALRFTFNSGFCFLGEIQVYERVTNKPATGYLMENDNILLGKSYTHNVTAFNGGSKDAGNALTDGVKGGSWYASDYLNAKQKEVEIVFPLENVTNVSELYMQFLTDTGAGVTLPKKATIYVQEADDAKWVRIYDGAVTNANFRVGSEEAFAAKNIKVALETEQFCFIKEVEAFKYATGNAVDGTLEVVPDNDNLFLGKTYTHNVESWYQGTNGDPDCTKLTNGTHESGYGTNMFNPQQAEVVVDFELDEDTTFAELVITATNGTAGIAAPNVTVSVKDSDDADWTDVYKGNTAGTIIVRATEEIVAKYVRFTFNGGTNYKFIGEIEAYALPRKSYTPTDYMAPIQYSLIKGMTPTYEVAPTFAYGGTSDLSTWTDAVVLGDGASYKQAPTFMSDAKFEYLKDGMSFKEISIATVNPTDELLGGAVKGIGSITIEALIDGEWVVIADKADYAYAANARLYAFGAEEAITADGVRFTIHSNKAAEEDGWNGVAISEISVFAEPEATEYDGVLAVGGTDEPSEEPSEPSEPSEEPVEPGAIAVEIANYDDEITIAFGYLTLMATTVEAAEGETVVYKWYRNDVEVSESQFYTMMGGANAGTYKVVATKTFADGSTATAEDSVVVKENTYFKNVAVGTSYEWISGMWGAYPDTDSKELTNGVLSTWAYYGNAEYAGADDPEIIFDLGEATELYRVAMLFMSTGNSGLAHPDTVKFQYSADKETWYDFGSEWTSTVTNKSGYIIADAMVDEAIEAQYIKLTATGSWVFLGEFLAYAEVIEAQAPYFATNLEATAEGEGEVVLTAKAILTDDGELSYQWYKDGAAIEGATEATYTATESGTYKVVATSTLEGTTASTESAECVVTVTTPAPAGFAVTGNLKKSGSTADATFELIADGAVVATTTVSGKTGAYAFADVAAGTYTLKVTKSKHAAREYEVVVADADVALDVEVWLYGDVTADGMINNADVMQINRKATNQASVFDQAANQDYRLVVANVTAITGSDKLINNADVMQINRKATNQASVFDRLV